MPARVDQIIQKVDNLNKNLVSHELCMSDNEPKIDCLENVMNYIAKTNSGDVESVVAEINKRGRRLSNVMIYGLPEYKSPDINCRISQDL